MDKPDVDSIDGLSPSLSIEQKTTSHNPLSPQRLEQRQKSMTIYVYFMHVWGRRIVQLITFQLIVKHRKRWSTAFWELPEKTRLQILSPYVCGASGDNIKRSLRINKEGFVRVRVDGEIYDVMEVPELHPNKYHDIDIVVDRLVVKYWIRSRLFDSVEIAEHQKVMSLWMSLVRSHCYSMNTLPVPTAISRLVN